jgi:membrane-bound lytic murein transglycosylase D
MKTPVFLLILLTVLFSLMPVPAFAGKSPAGPEEAPAESLLQAFPEPDGPSYSGSDYADEMDIELFDSHSGDGFLWYGHPLACMPGESADEIENKAVVTGSYRPVVNVPPIVLDYKSSEVASRAVESKIGLFSDRIRDRFSIWLSRSGTYIEMMKDILREKDIPEHMVFLPMIESGFNPLAFSRARASGPWQFIAATAKRYGLEIDWWKDERRDPVKSTIAAADYLKDLYGMFGSWNLAMAAYNAGEGKIQRAMKKSKSEDYWSLLNTGHIKDETKEYVPKFIAASIIASNPREYGFDDIQYHPPMSYEEIEITSPIDLAVAAECAGTTYEEIKMLNPELRRWCTPPDVQKYSLRIPAGTKATFLERLAGIPEEERFTMDRYTVKKGDTFIRISKRTGIPLHVILSLNPTEKLERLQAGSRIYLPPKGFFYLDADDKAVVKKATFKRNTPRKKTSSKKRAGRKI